MADFLKDNFPSMRNRIIKKITGAAVSVKELEFLKKSIPTPSGAIS